MHWQLYYELAGAIMSVAENFCALGGYFERTGRYHDLLWDKHNQFQMENIPKCTRDVSPIL